MCGHLLFPFAKELLIEKYSFQYYIDYVIIYYII